MLNNINETTYRNMAIHSKNYDLVKSCTFKQRLNLSIYAAQNQRKATVWHKGANS